MSFLQVLLFFVLWQVASSFFRASKQGSIRSMEATMSPPRFSPYSPTLSPASSQENGGGFTYSVILPKGSGITWGSDLSFRWVFVQDVEANSPAAKSNRVQRGDFVIAFNNDTLIAQDFDYVIKVRRRRRRCRLTD